MYANKSTQTLNLCQSMTLKAYPLTGCGSFWPHPPPPPPQPILAFRLTRQKQFHKSKQIVCQIKIRREISSWFFCSPWQMSRPSWLARPCAPPHADASSSVSQVRPLANCVSIWDNQSFFSCPTQSLTLPSRDSLNKPPKLFTTLLCWCSAVRPMPPDPPFASTHLAGWLHCDFRSGGGILSLTLAPQRLVLKINDART